MSTPQRKTTARTEAVRFAVGETIVFAEEPDSPYTVQAIGPRYAVLTRPATLADCESFEYPDPPAGTVVYTIVDSQTWKRGPDHWIVGRYNYSQRHGCEECLRELESGECEISRRRSIDVRLVGDDQLC